MIRDLNQVSFRDFGTILPERSGEDRLAGQDGTRSILRLSGDSAPLYRAADETWLCNGSGMTILSVSDGDSRFLDFYMDKPVCIKPGVLFCLTHFQQDSTVEMVCRVQPEDAGRRRGQTSFQMHRALQVKSVFTFFYQEKEQGFFFPGEAHSFLELTYVDQGTLHSVVDGRDLLLEQGEFAVYGPDQWHMQYADIGMAPRFVTITFELDGGDISALLDRKFRVPQAAAPLLQQMLREKERMDDYSVDMIIALLTQILLLVLRQTRQPQAPALRTAASVHNENEIIRRSQQYISAHIREKLSVPIVARNVDVSPSYLTALFHKHLQISPGEYIRRIKLQESKQMIRENNMNFTEIAAALQYSTVHHFSRQFKEKFGITPTEYAKSVK